MIEPLSAESLYEVLFFLRRKIRNRRNLENMSIVKTDRKEYKQLTAIPSHAPINVSRLRRKVFGGGLATLLSVPLNVRLTLLFSSPMASDVFRAKKT